MAGAIAPGELGSEHIIGPMENNIALRAERFLAEVGRPPSLDILSANPDDGPSNTYMGIKERVGEQLGIHVYVSRLASAREIRRHTMLYNGVEEIDGIIVQLPLGEGDAEQTDKVLQAVEPRKDVDGLSPHSTFTPATVRAVEAWLLGNGVDVMEESVAVIGLGRLVGAPLFERWHMAGVNIEAFDKTSSKLDIVRGLHKASLVVSATGHANLLTSDLFAPDVDPKILVDVGTSEQGGATHGDVSDELRAYALEHDWTLTPKRGGIGKITVRALFSNLMDAAEQHAGITEPINQYRVRQTLQATSSIRPADLFSEEDDRFITQAMEATLAGDQS